MSHNCRICGVLEDKYCHIDVIIERQLCHTCNFWQTHIEHKDDPECIRAGHKHYRVYPDKNSGFKGFGGHTFTIEMLDGRIITTSNLWQQGEIPERFWEQLPDNAKEFINAK